jgi:hypothetical protein
MPQEEAKDKSGDQTDKDQTIDQRVEPALEQRSQVIVERSLLGYMEANEQINNQERKSIKVDEVRKDNE